MSSAAEIGDAHKLLILQMRAELFFAAIFIANVRMDSITVNTLIEHLETIWKSKTNCNWILEISLFTRWLFEFHHFVMSLEGQLGDYLFKSISYGLVDRHLGPPGSQPTENI